MVFPERVSMNFPNLFHVACMRSPELLASPTSAYYVSTAGSDSNPGTQTHLGARFNMPHTPRVRACTINVRGGVYEELVSINASGNPSDGLRYFQKLPGERRPCRPGMLLRAGRSAILTIHDQSYVRIEGF